MGKPLKVIVEFAVICQPLLCRPTVTLPDTFRRWKMWRKTLLARSKLLRRSWKVFGSSATQPSDGKSPVENKIGKVSRESKRLWQKAKLSLAQKRCCWPWRTNFLIFPPALAKSQFCHASQSLWTLLLKRGPVTPQKHIIWEWGPEKRVPLEDREYLLGQRTKPGTFGSCFQLGHVDPASAQKEIRRQQRERRESCQAVAEGNQQTGRKCWNEDEHRKRGKSFLL